MPALQIERLSDEFGQYLIELTCTCGHVRRCYPRTLAAIAGWEARLSDLTLRMRCSKCGERRCTARAVQLNHPHPLRGA
jgi:hypothetical protein